LADAVARLDKKKIDEQRKEKSTTEDSGERRPSAKKNSVKNNSGKKSQAQESPGKTGPVKKKSSQVAKAAEEVVGKSPAAAVARIVAESSSAPAGPVVDPVRRPMPTTIHPMLAESVDEPFDGDDWLFEIKWDGYRAIAFIEDGKTRLLSRNQNDLTPRYPELKDMAASIQAGSIKPKQAILDGEVVALDENGRASFSLMQQRTGFSPGGRRRIGNSDVPVLYYAFDLLYLDGYDWRRVPLEQRKRKLQSLITQHDSLRYSDHYPTNGKALFEIARQKKLEGILAKKKASFYEERRTRDWLKIKIRHEMDCVVGGYTEPEGSRAHFGSLVLGLYGKQGNLIHVGQVGSGFDQKLLSEIWKQLKQIEAKKNPFYGEVEALRKVNWVKPELVAAVEYAEWTDGTNEGSGPKLRAPVFLGLRDDKDPKECVLEENILNEERS
jgi:bifunctional non-homologous end joining protein LigD